MVAFFAMTAMWASLNGAYQITVTGANGKTNLPATLTLNIKNKNAVSTWSCTVVLPAGVTYKEGSVAPVATNYTDPNPVITAVVNSDNSVTFTYDAPLVDPEAAEPVEMALNEEGPIATFDVEIAGTVEPGTYPVVVKGAQMNEPEGKIWKDLKEAEFTWTIEEGTVANKYDVNDDGKVNLSDALVILDKMAEGNKDSKYDVNGDELVNLSDFLSILDKMAEQ